MVVIRLTRVGKKNSPAYRVVVAEKRRAVKRKFIEIIGHFNPIKKPKEVVISRERALFWLKSGAKPSDTVRNLMADLEIIPKKDKVNIKYAKPKKKKEMKQEKADNQGKPKIAPAVEADQAKAEEKTEAEEKVETKAEDAEKDSQPKSENLDEKKNETSDDTAKSEQINDQVEDKGDNQADKENK